MMSVGAYYLVHKKQPIQIAQNQQHDIAPGRNQATLTLAGGQKIILTKGLSGKLAQQGNTLVQVNNANAITYTTSDTETSGPVQYNTMATRRGEQSPYPLVLADGTRVWLNAASSITFPTAFKGTDREVTIKGEVYFEVAHNAAMPFRVRSDGQTVEVLGTHFDINSYDDEQVIKTTLLEGKVKVTAAGDRSAILAPGEQSILSVNTPAQRIKVVRADIDIEMAWRDGMFRFDSTPLSSIMTQVARWYDVDVVYKDEGLKNKTFFAMSTRFANASQLLHNLEQTGEVKFKIDGKKITVQHP
jgi:ferric-dicitrate binding protein FerR (iron transport regulator)